MGLDYLELGTRVEEEFDVHIEDEDYERLKTVGDLEHYIRWKLGKPRTGGWSSYHRDLVGGFCRLRREIAIITGLSRSDLRPSTRIQDHWRTRGEWQGLQASLSATLGVPLPAWRVDDWMTAGCLCTLVSPLLSIACLHLEASQIWVLGTVAVCWVAGAAITLQRAQKQFSEARLSDLVRMSTFALSQSRAEAGVSEKGIPDEDILGRLIALVSEVGSIPVEEIHPKSRFIEDLTFG